MTLQTWNQKLMRCNNFRLNRSSLSSSSSLWSSQGARCDPASHLRGRGSQTQPLDQSRPTFCDKRGEVFGDQQIRGSFERLGGPRTGTGNQVFPDKKTIFILHLYKSSPSIWKFELHMIPRRWEAVPQPRVGEDGERGKQKRSSGDFFDRKKTTCMLYLQVSKCSCWQLEKWNWTIIGCGSGGPSVLWENGPIWGGVYWGELHLAIDQYQYLYQ